MHYHRNVIAMRRAGVFINWMPEGTARKKTA
jgi:hypothetical protein